MPPGDLIRQATTRPPAAQDTSVQEELRQARTQQAEQDQIPSSPAPGGHASIPHP